MRELNPAASLGLPLYKEVKRQMVAALAATEWKPGEAIPAEKQLCVRFGISIGTLRKAIDELVAENILIRHQGRGTFVAMHNQGPRSFRFFNYLRHDGKKIYPQLTVISFAKSKADKNVSEKLGIQNGAKTYQIITVRGLEAEPLLVEDIRLSEALFPGMSEAQLHNRPSTMYSLYQMEYGINVVRIEEGVRATLATPSYAELLNINPGAPLLQVHRLAFSYNDQPVEYRVSYVNTEHYQYSRAVA